MRRSSLFLLSLVAAACGDQEGEEVPFVELAADSEDSIDGFNASNPPPSRVALDPSVSGFESGGALLAATDTFQGAVPGRFVENRPVVQVVDAEGQPMAGVAVLFRTLNGGLVASSSAVTDEDGFAQVLDWQVGKSVGVYGLEAVAGGAALLFAAEATSSFGIQLRFETDVSDGVRASFEAAAARWSGVIRGDLTDITFDLDDLPADCDVDDGAAVRVDDLLILVVVREIDGEGQVLGQAGPCLVRTVDQSPLVGLMEFDRADLSRLLSRGLLDDTILHEMGHVIGIGILWEGLLQNRSVPDNSLADTRFLGDAAAARYQELGGSGFVPVENSGVPGSADGHWRESIFDNELMTPQLTLSDGALPLSVVTVGSLEDLGVYQVNYDAADEFQVYNPGVAALRLEEPMAHEERLLFPRHSVDEDGTVR